MASHHGRGHAARRSAARQLARTSHLHVAACPDSCAVDYFPAPRWTHDMRAALADENARARERSATWHYQPPPREPVAEAWGRLERERRAELLHHLAVDRARAAAEAAARAAIDRARGQLGLSHGWDPVPLSASAAVRAAVAKAVRGCTLPAVPPGAVLPLGAGNRTRLDRLAGGQLCSGLGDPACADGVAVQGQPRSTMLARPFAQGDAAPRAEGV